MALKGTPSVVAALLIGVSPVLAGGEASWVRFQDQTASRIDTSQDPNSGPNVVLTNVDEKDYAWGDLDRDGDIDLVAVYSQPGVTTGRRRNVLLMNENGVLVDRTTQFATASSVTLDGGAMSQGFLDLTNDRDVAIVDLTGDGWPEVVTATTLSGNPDGTIGDKAVSHPRIYINLADDPPGSGIWQGLIFDDVDRVPTMPAEPRFNAVASGDVDADGDRDLYFSDGHFGPYSRPVDLNDRLWINDGTGYFTDETSLRLTTQMVNSTFGASATMVDMNGDDALDIVKESHVSSPIAVSIIYNDPLDEGTYYAFQQIYTLSPTFASVGDLNLDEIPDVVITDDNYDRYLLGTGNGPDGLSDFAPTAVLIGSALANFGGNNHIADLNNDGLNDVLVANMDAIDPSCSQSSKLFRNYGLQPDGFSLTIAQDGNAGISPSHLNGVYDFAVFDINGDDWLDLVIGRCGGTTVYINQPPTTLAFSYPQGLPEILPPEQPLSLIVEITAQGVVQPDPGTGMQHVSVNGGPFVSSAMQVLSETTYLATLPAGSCLDIHSFYFSAETAGGATSTDPVDAPATTYEAIVATGAAITFEEDVEGDVSAWTVVSDPSLTSGEWEQADPILTVNAGFAAAPGDDAQPDPETAMAFVTENCPSSPCNATDFDVDGGPTDLISPLIDLDGADANITYFRWFYSSSPSGADVLETSVAGNGDDPSPTWVVVEQVSSTFDGMDTAWQQAGFRVGEYVTPTANVRVRFRAADVGTASVVEAGIDLFTVETITCQCACPADVSGDGLRDGGDIQGFVNCLLGIGTNCVCAETDGQAGLDSQDVAAFVNSLLAGSPCGL